MAKYTLSVYMDNCPGVLFKITNMLNRRGFNIESLAAGITDDPSKSRMTVIVSSDKFQVDQVVKQMNKIVHVLDITVLEREKMFQRELLLVKVGIKDFATRNEIIELAEVFRGRVVDVSNTSITIESTGDEEKNNALIQLLKPYGIETIARTGVIALERGKYNQN